MQELSLRSSPPAVTLFNEQKAGQENISNSAACDQFEREKKWFIDRVATSQLDAIDCYLQSLVSNKLHKKICCLAALLVEKEFDAHARLNKTTIDLVKEKFLSIKERCDYYKKKIEALFYLSQQLNTLDLSSDLSFTDRMRLVCKKYNLAEDFDDEEQRFYKNNKQKALINTTERIFFYLKNRIEIEEITLSKKMQRISAFFKENHLEKVIKRTDKLFRFYNKNCFFHCFVLFDLDIENREFRVLIEHKQASILKKMDQATESAHKWIADVACFIPADQPKPIVFVTNKHIRPFLYRKEIEKTTFKKNEENSIKRFKEELKIIKKLQGSSVIKIIDAFNLLNGGSAMLQEKAGTVLRFEKDHSKCEEHVVDLLQAINFYFKNKITIYESSEFYSLLPKFVQAVISVVKKNVCPDDIKPANFLLIEDRLALCDFEPGTNSPLFAAPEVLLNAPVNEKSLSWTLGIIIHQFLSNDCFAHPIDSICKDETVEQFRFQISKHQFKKPETVKNLQDLVLLTLQHNPEDRPKLTVILHYLNQLNPHIVHFGSDKFEQDKEWFIKSVAESNLSAISNYLKGLAKHKLNKELYCLAKLLVEKEFDSSAGINKETVRSVKLFFLPRDKRNNDSKRKISSLFFLAKKLRKFENIPINLSFTDKMREVCKRYNLPENFEDEEQKFYKEKQKALITTTERIFAYLSNNLNIEEITLHEKMKRMSFFFKDEPLKKIIKRADKLFRWCSISKSPFDAFLFKLDTGNENKFRAFVFDDQAYILKRLGKEATESTHKWIADAFDFVSAKTPCVFLTHKNIQPFEYKAKIRKTSSEMNEPTWFESFNEEIKITKKLQGSSVVKLINTFDLFNGGSAMLQEKAGATLRLKKENSTCEKHVVDLLQALDFYIQNKTTIYESAEFYSFLLKLVEAVISVVDQKVIPTDLKPENFLLFENRIGDQVEYRVVLSDFDSKTSSPLFTAPEVITSMHVHKVPRNKKALSWTLGVIIYQFLTNNSDAHPVPGTEDLNMPLHLFISKIINYKSAKPTGVKSLNDLVNSTIQLKPEHRPDLKEILYHLNELNPHKTRV